MDVTLIALIVIMVILFGGLILYNFGISKRKDVTDNKKIKFIEEYKKVTNNKVKDEDLEKIYNYQKDNLFEIIGFSLFIIGALALFFTIPYINYQDSQEKLELLANGVCLSDLNSKLMPGYTTNIDLTDTELVINCYNGYITYPVASVQK